jgi:hypothetical protein
MLLHQQLERRLVALPCVGQQLLLGHPAGLDHPPILPSPLRVVWIVVSLALLIMRSAFSLRHNSYGV